MDSYATRDDVYQLALSAAAFIARGRPVASSDVDGPTGTIRIKGHGLSAADVVTFEKTAGGTLPAGISEFVPYYPLPVSSDLFKVAATPSGTAITFVSVGTGWGVAVDPGRRLDAHLVQTASQIDEHLTAHDPPLKVDPITGKYPQVVVGMNARMAGRAAVNSLQVENAAYKVAIDRLVAQQEFDEMILDDWKNGKPVQPRPVDQTDEDDNGALAGASRSPINWTTGSL